MALDITQILKNDQKALKGGGSKIMVRVRNQNS
jgi:hypothetical protein